MCVCSCSYDFGYLTKLLTCQDLPSTDKEFFELLHTYFPCIFDIKYLMEICDRKGGLNQLAEEMNVSVYLCRLFLYLSTGIECVSTGWDCLSIVSSFRTFLGLHHP